MVKNSYPACELGKLPRGDRSHGDCFACGDRFAGSNRFNAASAIGRSGSRGLRNRRDECVSQWLSLSHMKRMLTGEPTLVRGPTGDSLPVFGSMRKTASVPDC